MLWLRFIDYIFFIWTHGKEELKKFMEKFNNFIPNMRFTYESSEKGISFFDLIITVSEQVENYVTYKVYRSPSVTIAYIMSPHT